MNIEIKEIIESADAVVIGAGAGLSAAAGLTYSGERFEKNFSEFIAEYGMTDMYSAGFYPFPTQEEKWAYWSKHIMCNRYDVQAGEVYLQLYELVKDKEYFVLTTNVDHQFWKAGFEDDRIFATQGDYGLFQCSKACHTTLYDNEAAVKSMISEQTNLKIPSALVPKCPNCGEAMDMNLRKDNYFVQDDHWDEAHEAYQKFIARNQKHKIVFLELGVGMNTPVIIKYPFWRLTKQLENAFYICLNKGEAHAPEEIQMRSLCMNTDIADVFKSS